MEQLGINHIDGGINFKSALEIHCTFFLIVHRSDQPNAEKCLIPGVFFTSIRTQTEASLRQQSALFPTECDSKGDGLRRLSAHMPPLVRQLCEGLFVCLFLVFCFLFPFASLHALALSLTGAQHRQQFRDQKKVRQLCEGGGERKHCAMCSCVGSRLITHEKDFVQFKFAKCIPLMSVFAVAADVIQ